MGNEKSDTLTVRCIECGEKEFPFSYKTLEQIGKMTFTCPDCSAITQVDLSKSNGFESMNVREVL